MQKGFRTSPKPTKAKVNTIETEFRNVQMATQLSQTLMKQLMENMKNLASDVETTHSQLFNLQYKVLAMQKALNLDPAALDLIVEGQRLIDFNEAAIKADAKDDLVVADLVGQDSTITMTSIATDASGKDVGIARSRMKLSETGVPDLINGFMNQPVGTKIYVTLNNVIHEIELLAIRNPVETLKPILQEVTH